MFLAWTCFAAMGNGDARDMPGAAISTPRRQRDRVGAMFRYLLRLPDGVPNDPAGFVSAIPNWAVGEVITLGAGQQLRVLANRDGDRRRTDRRGLQRRVHRRARVAVAPAERVSASAEATRCLPLRGNPPPRSRNAKGDLMRSTGTYESSFWPAHDVRPRGGPAPYGCLSASRPRGLRRKPRALEEPPGGGRARAYAPFDSCTTHAYAQGPEGETSPSQSVRRRARRVAVLSDFPR